MKGALNYISILVCAFLVSCSTLQSPHLIGESTDFKEHVGNESVWKFQDEVYHVRIVSSNTAAVAVVDWDKGSKNHNIDTGNLIITELNGHVFVHVKDEELYTVYHLTTSGDDKLVFYPVDDDRIDTHVESGHVGLVKWSSGLPGSGSGVYLLKGTKEEIDKFISENLYSIFDPDSPLVAELILGEM